MERENERNQIKEVGEVKRRDMYVTAYLRA